MEMTATSQWQEPSILPTPGRDGGAEPGRAPPGEGQLPKPDVPLDITLSCCGKRLNAAQARRMGQQQQQQRVAAQQGMPQMNGGGMIRPPPGEQLRQQPQGGVGGQQQQPPPQPTNPFDAAMQIQQQ